MFFKCRLIFCLVVSNSSLMANCVSHTVSPSRRTSIRCFPSGVVYKIISPGPSPDLFSLTSQPLYQLCKDALQLFNLPIHLHLSVKMVLILYRIPQTLYMLFYLPAFTDEGN